MTERKTFTKWIEDSRNELSSTFEHINNSIVLYHRNKIWAIKYVGMLSFKDSDVTFEIYKYGSHKHMEAFSVNSSIIGEIYEFDNPKRECIKIEFTYERFIERLKLIVDYLIDYCKNSSKVRYYY
ncbi:gp36 [Sphingomonas phage PAU]|uniref:gp36 n=1 Tax=Sphingomonas phage PAU TaxID=1150991 RepID=UPI0002573129|nr:gp36 [Sphingomonas phage PAU]AFF28034.1 gp36 [Sphingomonas phage PAU]